MKRKLDADRLVNLSIILVFGFIFISWTWYSNLESQDTMIFRGEWVENCFESGGTYAKCNKPLEDYRESKKNLRTFILFGIGSSISIFIIYKLAEYLYPPIED